METDDFRWKENVSGRIGRIINQTLEDIVPTTEISPKKALIIKSGVTDYVHYAVLEYAADHKGKLRYGHTLAAKLLENVEREKDRYVLDEVKGLAAVLSQL